jgi:hypothetical protein
MLKHAHLQTMSSRVPATLRSIWKQNKIPVLYTRGEGYPLLIRLPDGLATQHWLRGGRHHSPKWVPQFSCWETPRAWFDSLVQQLLRRFRFLYIIQPRRDQTTCARSCWEAKGDDCECKCLGEFHGKSRPGGRWFEVTETLAFQWGEKTLAYRLIETLRPSDGRPGSSRGSHGSQF